MRFSSLHCGKILRSAGAGLCLAMLILMAGCGGGGSTTAPHYTAIHLPTPPTPSPCATPTPLSTPTQGNGPTPINLWAPDLVIVSLVSPSSDFADAGLSADIAAQVGNVIANALPPQVHSSLSSGQLSIWGDGLGAVVFRVTHPECLQQAVDSLNKWDQQSGGLAFTYNNSQYNNGQGVSFPIEITGASPDWYTIAAASDSTPCCGNGIGGSPGGHPFAASTTATSTSSSAGGGETVYVLDTADPLTSPPGPATPNPATLCPSIPNNPCYTEMNSLSTVTQETDSPVRNEKVYLPEYDPTGTNTDIREHGMFISDLIHHVAPNARIKLLRTLNDHGAGDILDLMGQLSTVLTNPLSGAIVNMSLTTVLSPGCLLDVWYNWQATYFSLAQNGALVCGDPDALTNVDLRSLRLMFTPLAQLIQALQDNKRDLLVAAAGAHGPNATDVYAGMPAAFCGVRAVAAAASKVANNWQVLSPNSATPSPATFSSGNVSNLPYLSGGNCLQFPPGSANTLNTLKSVLQAGRYAPPPMPQVSPTNPANTVAALGVRVCSVYPQNTTSVPAAPPAGWATWDGTSFATGLISGNLAANSGALPSTLDESQPCQVQ